MPAKRWRLYVFKGDEKHEPYHLHRFSHYLIGRERKVITELVELFVIVLIKVCTIILENPSISSQHAVLQYRQVDHIPALFPSSHCGNFPFEVDSKNKVGKPIKVVK